MPTNQSSPWGGGKLHGGSNADITTTAAATKTAAAAKVPLGVQASLELSRQKDQAKPLPDSSAAPQRQRGVALSGASAWENGDACKSNTKSQFTAVPHGCSALPQLRNGTAASSIYKREWPVGFNGGMSGVAQKCSLIQSSSPEKVAAVIRHQASSNKLLLSPCHQDLFIQGQSPLIHHKSTLNPADCSTSSPPVPPPCLTLPEHQGAAQGNDASTRDRTRSTANETITTERCHSAKLATKPSPTENGCATTVQSHGRLAPPAGLAKTADKKPQSPEVGPFPNGPMPTVPSACVSATQELPPTPQDAGTGAACSPVVSVTTQISEIHLTRQGQPVFMLSSSISPSSSSSSSSSSPAEENGIKESPLSGTESVMQVDGCEEELPEELENVCSDDDESEYSELNGCSSMASFAMLSGIEEPMSFRDVEAGEERPALVPSLFPLIPPTLYFSYANEKVEMLPVEQRRLLKWKMSTVTPNVVRHIIFRSHFKITKKNHDWVGCWGHHMKSCGFRVLEAHQKLNHFPGTFQIGRKDRLWKNLSKMQVHFGKREFSFFPRTFILPQDIKLLRKAWDDGAHRQKWIIKPPASARGTGIQVIHKWSQMPRKRPLLVQKYLHKPYLIGGSKFDLRIYAYVTCYDPLRIYIFNDGLVRFASCKYSSSMKTLGNKFMHLTNYSVNKKNSEYQTNSDDKACQGHKWALKALWQYLGAQDVNTTQIWEKIKDIVVKTIIGSEPYVTNLLRLHLKSPYSCHELFGFDIMLDEKLKPWILEVNISPSLHSSSALDVSIKGHMIRDLLNLAGFRIPLKAEVATPCSSTSSSTSSLYGSMIKEKATPDLSADEKVKRAFYVGQSYTDQDFLSSMLDVLTPEDVRVLAETEDELSRQGEFERIFPTSSSSRYLRFFEAPRYLNILLDQWEQRYWNDRTKGITLLQTLCEKGVHQGTTDPAHIWSKSSYVSKFVTNKPDINGTSKSRVVVTYHRRLPSDDEDEDGDGACDREVASASASSLPLSPSPCSSVTSSACASPQPGPAPSMLTQHLPSL